MKKIILALLLTTTDAVADMPPLEYRYKPKMPVVEQVVKYGQAYTLCGYASPKWIDNRHLYGCQWFEDGKCYIVYSWSIKDRKMRSNVRTHELAHCNGWRH